MSRTQFSFLMSPNLLFFKCASFSKWNEYMCIPFSRRKSYFIFSSSFLKEAWKISSLPWGKKIKKQWNNMSVGYISDYFTQCFPFCFHQIGNNIHYLSISGPAPISYPNLLLSLSDSTLCRVRSLGLIQVLLCII